MDRPGEPLVLVSRQGSLATLELNRPDRMNAVSLDLYRALDRALGELGDEPDLRALVLTGAGRAFSVGADLDAHARGIEGEEGRRAYVQAAQDVAGRIQALPQVVVAAAGGHAIGAGLELLLACDLSVVSEDAKYRFPELALGTFVGAGVTRALLQRVGRTRAAELLFLAPMLSGRDALGLGLVNRAVPAARVLPVAMSLAEDVARKAPASVAAAKSLLGLAGHTPLDDVLRLEAEALLACMRTADWREGIRAFQEERDPEFRGE
ncbi:MAG: enoyl-CoA hydratase/isomerase family protein [Gemmatimonadota bacterium]